MTSRKTARRSSASEPPRWYVRGHPLPSLGYRVFGIAFRIQGVAPRVYGTRFGVNGSEMVGPCPRTSLLLRLEGTFLSFTVDTPLPRADVMPRSRRQRWAGASVTPSSPIQTYMSSRRHGATVTSLSSDVHVRVHMSYQRRNVLWPQPLTLKP